MLALPSYCQIQTLDAETVSIAMARLPGYVGEELRKSHAGARVCYRIDGVASSAARDNQGDVIEPDALDWRPLLKSGFINNDHKDGSPRDLIGYPDRIYPTEVTDSAGTKYPGTGVTGFLFDVPVAHEYAHLYRSCRGVRQLGFSVEGPPPVRSAHDRTRIVKATVCHLAATFWPANRTCVANIDALAKSMSKGMGIADIAAMIPEDLDLARAFARIRRELPGATDEQCRRILAVAKGRT